MRRTAEFERVVTKALQEDIFAMPATVSWSETYKLHRYFPMNAHNGDGDYAQDGRLTAQGEQVARKNFARDLANERETFEKKTNTAYDETIKRYAKYRQNSRALTDIHKNHPAVLEVAQIFSHQKDPTKKDVRARLSSYSIAERGPLAPAVAEVLSVREILRENQAMKKWAVEQEVAVHYSSPVVSNSKDAWSPTHLKFYSSKITRQDRLNKIRISAVTRYIIPNYRLSVNGSLEVRLSQDPGKVGVFQNDYQSWNVYAKSYKHPAQVRDTVVVIPNDWRVRVLRHDIAVIDGKVTLDATPGQTTIPNTEIFKAQWMEQGKGTTVAMVQGYIASTGNYQCHGTTPVRALAAVRRAAGLPPIASKNFAVAFPNPDLARSGQEALTHIFYTKDTATDASLFSYPVLACPITISAHPDQQFFVFHDRDSERNWGLSEASTGYQIVGSCRSQKDAIAEGKAMLSLVSPKDFSGNVAGIASLYGRVPTALKLTDLSPTDLLRWSRDKGCPDIAQAAQAEQKRRELELKIRAHTLELSQ